MANAGAFLALFSDFPTFRTSFEALSPGDKNQIYLEVQTRLLGAGGDPTKVEPFGVDLIDFLNLNTPLTPSTEPFSAPESFVPIPATEQPLSAEQTPQLPTDQVNPDVGNPTLPSPQSTAASHIPPPPPLPTQTLPFPASQAAATGSLIIPSVSAGTTGALNLQLPHVNPPLQPRGVLPIPSYFPSPPPGFPTSLASISTSSTALSQYSYGQTSNSAGLPTGQMQFFNSPAYNPLYGQSSVSSGSSPAYDLTQRLAQIRLENNPPMAQARFSEDELSELWDKIDNYELTGIDVDAFKIFEYQGFNPSAILGSIKAAAELKKVDEDTMMMDIVYMCAVAAIKGAVNDHNIKRMSPTATARIKFLEERYGVKRGGGRGEPPNVITFSRVAASFPGIIMRLIQQGRIPARDFIGPLKSNTLPAVMRHQAFAAVIPRTLRERAREFLLALSTAFSVDQSYCIRPDKKEKFVVEEVFEKQRNFIQIAANARYPKEAVRITMFKKLQLEHDAVIDCARAVQAKIPDFRILTREEFTQAMAALP
ncbi:nucleocapsid protein [Brassica campestris chinensis coguvirus 1]|uniref:Nucleoprotein n=1 Tax=Brassica campestris chinensis coguvirus 1 TaxID=2894929 RepID=A0A8K1Z7E6_9VIRU|nr:nucleocapsid protein [Brassica campestris chinensis coguvirus 1]UFE16636.1 nucleocapsid protein [Brassica campestris chinensis coguvirus 1]